MAERNAALVGGNRLRLGLFAANCSEGRTYTTVPERWDASWDHNVALAQMGDGLGIECMVPIARWKGYGGDTNPSAWSFESLAWACGLLALTRRINVLATVHVSLMHPLIAAKQMATADQIGHGRFGVNVVCGSHEDEFQMFGVQQLEHDARYDQGEEWWRIITRAWAGGDAFDFAGAYYRLHGVESAPGPYAGKAPLMMNAATSDAGRVFGIRNADMHFTHFRSGGEKEHIAETKRLAREHGREIQVWTALGVVCRSTRDEAQSYAQYVVENADPGAMALVSRRAQPSGLSSQEVAYQQVIANGGPCVVGNADDVAAMLGRHAEGGIDGVMINFVNYLDELPYFAQEVLPRLEADGLRAARTEPAPV